MPSSAIRDVDYDENSQELFVEFTSGRRYRYYDVPLDVAAGLATASSQGAYFNEHIRDRYDCRELD